MDHSQEHAATFGQDSPEQAAEQRRAPEGGGERSFPDASEQDAVFPSGVSVSQPNYDTTHMSVNGGSFAYEQHVPQTPSQAFPGAPSANAQAQPGAFPAGWGMPYAFDQYGRPLAFPPYYGYQQQSLNHPISPAQQTQTPPSQYPSPAQTPWPAQTAPQPMSAGAPTSTEDAPPQRPDEFARFDKPARIAVYDDLRSAPRVIQVQGGPTHDFIERICDLTHKSAREAGGKIPYNVIREASENFIHANFEEVVVSILDDGNTIRFSDQGPGIRDKELVKEPGFTSASEPMKRYIRGIGSGLPAIESYLEATNGYIRIEDNVNRGAVVTISLLPEPSTIPEPDEDMTLVELTNNEKAIARALFPDEELGVTELNKATGLAVSSIHASLKKMEEAGLVEKVGKKRKLTPRGVRNTHMVDRP